MSYTVVALPEDSYLKQLNAIKNFFYLNNFRYTIKPCQENAHITLLQLDWDIPDTLEKDIKHLLKKKPGYINFLNGQTNILNDADDLHFFFQIINNLSKLHNKSETLQ